MNVNSTDSRIVPVVITTTHLKAFCRPPAVRCIMTDLYTGTDVQLPHIPDNMSIAQFMLDHQHEIRPPLDDGVPCLVDSKTGKAFRISQVSFRMNFL